MSPEEPPTEDPVARLYRREKLWFRWAGAFVALAFSTWVGARIFTWITLLKIHEAIAAGQVSGIEISQRLTERVKWAGVFVTVFVIFMVAFLICLTGWMMAIHRRRKTIGGLPPPA